jgi:RHS repeat-associated protein
VATYRYDSYGNLVASTGSIADPFKFAGQYQDSELGLHYLRARYYDPVTGQFATFDPALRQTRTLFLYVGANPLNRSDRLWRRETRRGARPASRPFHPRCRQRAPDDSSATTNQTKFNYTRLNQLCYVGSGTSNACRSSPPGQPVFRIKFLYSRAPDRWLCGPGNWSIRWRARNV